MPDLVNAASVRRLQKAVESFRDSVSLPSSGAWKELTDAEIWATVLRQIAVVGGAKSGDQLHAELATDLERWYELLRRAPSAIRPKEIHKRLRKAGVRYVTSEVATCKKSKAAAYNFDLLQAYGGPRKYFSSISDVPAEAWRIAIVSDDLQFIRNKGARDLLTWLGLADNAIALDSRVQAVLAKLGVPLPSDLATNKVKYKALEQELLEKVCRPCSITGAHLDRILFYRWKEVA